MVHALIYRWCSLVHTSGYPVKLTTSITPRLTVTQRKVFCFFFDSRPEPSLACLARDVDAMKVVGCPHGHVKP